MITQQALKEAIAEVQGKRDPNRNDCMMLAAFYTIQDHLYPQEESGYSYAPEPTTKEDEIGEYGDSDFLQAIKGKDPAAVWAVMDELMDTLSMVNHRVYDGVMRKIG